MTIDRAVMAFVGASLLQGLLSRFRPMATLLKRPGVRPGAAL